MEAILTIESGILVFDGFGVVIGQKTSIKVTCARLITSIIEGRAAGITGWTPNAWPAPMTSDADFIGKISTLTAIGRGVSLTVRGSFLFTFVGATRYHFVKFPFVYKKEAFARLPCANAEGVGLRFLHPSCVKVVVTDLPICSVHYRPVAGIGGAKQAPHLFLFPVVGVNLVRAQVSTIGGDYDHRRMVQTAVRTVAFDIYGWSLLGQYLRLVERLAGADFIDGQTSHSDFLGRCGHECHAEQRQ